MNRQPEPSTQEVLAGLIERVTYHNVENGFCVLFGISGYETWSPAMPVSLIGVLTVVDAALLGPRRFYLTSP
jgi:hypothetical protein